MNMSCTTTGDLQEPLTLDKIKEAMDLLNSLPPSPVFIFSHYVPYDQAYHGEIVDKMAKQADPFFNPKRQKAYLLNVRHEEMLTRRFTSTPNFRRG